MQKFRHERLNEAYGQVLVEVSINSKGKENILRFGGCAETYTIMTLMKERAIGLYTSTRVALEMIHQNLSARAHTRIFF